MRTERGDDLLLLNYLLGNLTEEEQAQVEDRAFRDGDYLAALEAAEADLIDGYVRGELSETERRQFERRFLASPQRRDKVEFARALARVARESKPAQRTSSWRALLNFVRGWNPALQVAAAAAVLLCIVGTSWLAVQNADLRSRLGALEAERREVDSRQRMLEKQLGDERARAGQASSRSSQELTPLIASLVFVPGLSRAGASVQQLVLNPSVKLARIEIQLEPRDDFQRFRAELRSRGEDVLTLANLLRLRTKAGYSVLLEVPAGTLSPGEYELALKGVTGGQTTDVGYYYFSVKR